MTDLRDNLILIDSLMDSLITISPRHLNAMTPKGVGGYVFALLTRQFWKNLPDVVAQMPVVVAAPLRKGSCCNTATGSSEHASRLYDRMA